MSSFTIPSIIQRTKKRVGRGHGSGKVKTSGRGTKGQNVRGHAQLGFEGGQLALIKRLPFIRGKRRNMSRQEKPVAVDIAVLMQYPANAVIDLQSLKKNHILSDRSTSAKILGTVALSHAYTVKLPCSQSAKDAIEKAGGKVEK